MFGLGIKLEFAGRAVGRDGGPTKKVVNVYMWETWRAVRSVDLQS